MKNNETYLQSINRIAANTAKLIFAMHTNRQPDKSMMQSCTDDMIIQMLQEAIMYGALLNERNSEIFGDFYDFIQSTMP